MACLTAFSALTTSVVLLFACSGRGSEIFGGEEIKPHSLPFMAFLEPDCGGILIDPEWVLTAAHCYDREQVLLGAHSLTKKEKSSKQHRKVALSVPHPCYDEDEKINDLMLLKLNKPAKLTKTVKCLRLESVIKDPKPGTKCLAAGWGETRTPQSEDVVMSDVLMSVGLTVVDRATCSSLYNGQPYIGRTLICAGSDPKSRMRGDTCRGDSGGPLLCDGVFVGVTSFGDECGITTRPGVYSFLTERQLQWIHTTMSSSDL